MIILFFRCFPWLCRLQHNIVVSYYIVVETFTIPSTVIFDYQFEKELQSPSTPVRATSLFTIEKNESNTLFTTKK